MQALWGIMQALWRIMQALWAYNVGPVALWGIMQAQALRGYNADPVQVSCSSCASITQALWGIMQALLGIMQAL